MAEKEAIIKDSWEDSDDDAQKDKDKVKGKSKESGSEKNTPGYEEKEDTGSQERRKDKGGEGADDLAEEVQKLEIR